MSFLTLLFCVLFADHEVIEDPVLELNQAMYESLITFHAISEFYFLDSNGNSKLVSKSEQWKKDRRLKAIDHQTPPNGSARTTISQTLDGVSMITYHPNYPPEFRAERSAVLLMPGSIMDQLGFRMMDVKGKRNLTPSEMIAAGYRVLASKPSGNPGSRIFEFTYDNGTTILISELHNYMVIGRATTDAGIVFRSTSEEIKEIAPGIYIPFRINYEEKRPGGVVIRSMMKVLKAEANQPIDENVFKLDLGEGVSMTDFTVGKAFFVKPDGTVIKENPNVKFTGALQRLSEPITIARRTTEGDSGIIRMILFCLAALLAVAAFILFFKRRMVRL